MANKDSEIQDAFTLFAGDDGVIDADEMRMVVPLLGEDLDNESIDALFKQADKDASGHIDFPEFCQMCYSLSPKGEQIEGGSLLERTVELTKAQEGVDVAKKAVDEAHATENERRIEKAVDGLAEALLVLMIAEENIAKFTDLHNAEPFDPRAKMMEIKNASAESVLTAKTLHTNIQVRLLKPADHQLAGRIIERMEASGLPNGTPFTKDDINNVVMALCAQNEQEMEPSFNLLSGGDETIDAEEFRQVVPLLGENATPEEIDALFRKADKDGSGQIDFEEYCSFLGAMQMKGGSHARLAVVARERAMEYRSPRQAKFPDLGKDLGPAVKTMLSGGHVDTGTVFHLLKKLFEDADTDSSGSLDHFELGEVVKAYYRLEGVSRSLDVAQREVDEAMVKYDTDNSGRLELKEFVKMFADTSADATFKTKVPTDVLNKVGKLADRMGKGSDPFGVF